MGWGLGLCGDGVAVCIVGGLAWMKATYRKISPAHIVFIGVQMRPKFKYTHSPNFGIGGHKS